MTTILLTIVGKVLYFLFVEHGEAMVWLIGSYIGMRLPEDSPTGIVIRRWLADWKRKNEGLSCRPPKYPSNAPPSIERVPGAKYGPVSERIELEPLPPSSEQRVTPKYHKPKVPPLPILLVLVALTLHCVPASARPAQTVVGQVPGAPTASRSMAWLHAGVVLMAQGVQSANVVCADVGAVLLTARKLEAARDLGRSCSAAWTAAAEPLHQAAISIKARAPEARERVRCAARASAAAIRTMRGLLPTQAFPPEVDQGLEVADELSESTTSTRCS